VPRAEKSAAHRERSLRVRSSPIVVGRKSKSTPLVVPGQRPTASAARSASRRRPLGGVNEAVMSLEHAQMHLRDQEMDILAGVADQRGAFLVPREVRSRGLDHQAKQHLGRVVAAEEERGYQSDRHRTCTRDPGARSARCELTPRRRDRHRRSIAVMSRRETARTPGHPAATCSPHFLSEFDCRTLLLRDRGREVRPGRWPDAGGWENIRV